MKSLEERFWIKVQKTDTCWIWKGAKNNRGYAQIRIIEALKWKTILASHVSREIHFGKIPKELYVLHKCDNPSCVNPSHLFLGTQSDNMQDALKKGRIKNRFINKTHCSKGHPLFGENLYIDSRKNRACRECHRRWWREWNERREK